MNISSSTTDTDHELAQLLEQVSNHVMDGDLAAAEALIDQLPAHAARLRRMLPAIEVLSVLDRPTADKSTGSSVPPADINGSNLGDFRLLREIGRGGMGVVYEAEQVSLGRPVALKVLPLAATLSPQQLQRFKNEARAAATLKHPHIVGVYSVGVERGVHYYAMELIEGRSLAQAIAELSGHSHEGTPTESGAVSSSTDTSPVAALSTVRTADPQDYFRQVARLMADAADALNYAHNQGVVHRDIKPANLMIDQQSQVWVTDFGLARLESDVGVTLTGDILGTLRYMSPEQAAGKPGMVDYRTDIHALGATLHELVSLRPAFDSDDRGELLKRIATEAPPLLRRVDPRVPIDLETIAAKAMEKDPTDRYESAGMLAVDLRAFAEDRAIAARPPTLAARTQRWARRHSTLVASALVFLTAASLLLGLGLAVINHERAKAAVALDETQDSLQFARLAVDQMYTEVATEWLSSGLEITPTQRGFLEKALRVYRRLADEARDDPPSLWEAGTSYGRVAQIQHKLGQYRQANSAYQLSIDIHQGLLGEFAGDPDRHAQLAATYDELATLHAANEKLPEATAAWEAAQALLAPLTSKYPTEQTYQAALALNQLDRAAVLLRHDGPSEAEQLVRTAIDTFDRLRKEDDTSSEYKLAAFRGRVQLAQLLRIQGKLHEAEKLVSAVKVRLEFLANDEFDLRRLKSIQIAALTELADVLVAAGRLEDAATALDHVLEIAQHAMRSDVAPNVQLLQSISRDAEWARYAEPEALLQFIEIEIRQGAVLGRLGHFYEAQQTLADAVRTAYTLRNYYSLPRFAVAEANARVSLAELLRDASVSDSGAIADSAARAWQRLLRFTPSTASYRSGIHAQADLDWFLEQFPEQRSVVYAEQPPPKPASFNEGLVILGVALGVEWYPVNALQAIAFLDDYAAPDSGADSYAWFYLAMAYHQVGENDKAAAIYQQATQWMDQNKPDNGELHKLRAEAGELLENTEADMSAETDPPPPSPPVTTK